VDGLTFKWLPENYSDFRPNGAGKTTTIRILTTLPSPVLASLHKRPQCVGEAQRVKSEFGIVQQHISLHRDLTVRENLELHARLHHLPPAERKNGSITFWSMWI